MSRTPITDTPSWGWCWNNRSVVKVIHLFIECSPDTCSTTTQNFQFLTKGHLNWFRSYSTLKFSLRNKHQSRLKGWFCTSWQRGLTDGLRILTRRDEKRGGLRYTYTRHLSFINHEFRPETLSKSVVVDSGIQSDPKVKKRIMSPSRSIEVWLTKVLCFFFLSFPSEMSFD